MDYSKALVFLKNGHRLARDGWNGKHMFIFYVGAGTFEHDDYGTFEALPYIAMKTVQGQVVPWLASQTDQLAEDWVLIDAPNNP